MLKVTAIQDKETQKLIVTFCKAKFDPAAMAYAAYDDKSGEEELVGVVQFTFYDKAGHIVSLSSPNGVDDFSALFLLGRAAMNYTDLCGIEDMYSELDESMSKKLGFKLVDGMMYVNLKGFFTSPCQHEK